MITEIYHRRDPEDYEEEGIYSPESILLTRPFHRLTVIEWHGEEARPWLPTLIGLSPNLQRFSTIGSKNVGAILHCTSPFLGYIKL